MQRAAPSFLLCALPHNALISFFQQKRQSIAITGALAVNGQAS
jgi:hypothetical protein